MDFRSSEDPSFDVYSTQLKTAIEEAYTPLPGAESANGMPEVRRLLDDVEAPDPTAQSGSHGKQQSKHEQPRLPPLDIVLRLLRYSQSEAPRFFVDVPILNLEDFIRSCRRVYFATEPYSSWMWITVNVGLYHLFLATPATLLDLTETEKLNLLHNLERNIDVVATELRVTLEPSLEACVAMALLVTYLVKTGQSVLAWRTCGAAARACLDLGYHRLPPPQQIIEDKTTNQERFTFWYILAWDNGLAFTCGRTPTIHRYDVSTVQPVGIEQRMGVPGLLYGAFMDYNLISSEVHHDLFSASAKKKPAAGLLETADRLASSLLDLQQRLRDVNRYDPTWHDYFEAAVVVVTLLVQSLLVIVYRIKPLKGSTTHPFACSEECINAARTAMKTLIEAGQAMHTKSPISWRVLLNTIFSLVPCVSIIVLTGNAIATSSNADWELISSAISVLGLATNESPVVRKVHGACEKFFAISRLLYSNGQQRTVLSHPLATTTTGQGLFEGDQDLLTMSEADWDAMMLDFGVESGAI